MNRSTAAPDPWLAPPAPGPPALLRLFCLPYAGAGASVFRGWQRELPAGVEVWRARLPGREARYREPACSAMGPLADALATALAPLTDRPYAVYGHSMGALVAFEVVRRLRRASRPEPAALFVGAMRAPHLPDPYPPLYQLPAEEFRDALRARYGLLDEALDHPELLAALFPTLHADSQVCDTYACAAGRPLSCALVAYGGRADGHVTAAELRAWGEHTTGPFAAEILPGDHFFLESARQALMESLAGHLRRILER